MNDLEETLRKNPDDTNAWLVYADALLEKSDARGDVISLGHELEKRDDPELRKRYAACARKARWPKGAPRPRMRYRVLFEEMVREIREHPEIDFLAMGTGGPAPVEALEAAERTLGLPLPADMRAFYAEMNGMFLEWGLRGAEYRSTPPFGYPDYGNPPGSINMLPIEIAISSDWQASSTVNEVNEDEQTIYFGAPFASPSFGACVIDNFSMYNHADLVLGPEPVVICSTDHGADMSSSDFMSFATYLDATFAYYGISRYAAFGIGWSRKPERIDTWTKYPSLSELVANIERT